MSTNPSVCVIKREAKSEPRDAAKTPGPKQWSTTEKAKPPTHPLALGATPSPSPFKLFNIQNLKASSLDIWYIELNTNRRG